MSISGVEASTRRVKFGRLERRAVFLGLGWAQLGIVLAGALIFLGTAVSGHIVRGLLIGGLIVAVGLIRIFGETIPTWISRGGGYVMASAKGQNKFERRPGEVTREQARADEKIAAALRKELKQSGKHIKPPERMALPGEGAELLCYTLDNGVALVHDPVSRTVSFACEVQGDGFNLLDTDEQDARVDAWGQLLVAFASHEGVVRVQTLDRTVVYPSQDIRDYYLDQVGKHAAGPNVNRLAHEGYVDLIRQANTHTQHNMYMAVAMSEAKLRSRVKELGGGMSALMYLASTEMAAIEEDLPSSGIEVVGWLRPRELGAIIRQAYDPDSSEELGLRTGEFAGASLAEAGPTGGERSWSHMHTDSSLHRSYWISEWPRVGVAPGFLEELIFAGDFVHTVSLIAEPQSSLKALKRAEQEIQDAEAALRAQQKFGREVTLAQEQEIVDIRSREEQLVSGHAEARFYGLVSVSAPDMAALGSADSRLKHAAAKAKLELRNLYGQQHAGFMGAALPLARGLAKKDISWTNS